MKLDGSSGIFPVPYSFISLAHLRDPYPFFSRIRREAPVLKVPVPGFGGADQFLVTGHEHVKTVLRSPAYSSDMSMRALGGDFTNRPRHEADIVSMAVLDRPEHTRVRGLVRRAFTQERVEALRADIKQLADALLDQAAARRRMDVISDVAVPLTSHTFSKLLGVPSEDHVAVRAWAESILGMSAGGEHLEQAQRFQALVQPVLEYFSSLISERRRAPREDLVSAMLLARDGHEQLTDGEVLGNCLFLLFAGYEPAVNLMGTGLWSLLRFPEQLRQLRRDPALLAPAVEEMLRYESPSQAMVRITREDCVLGGQQIKKASIVVCAIGAANRDPAVFPEPDTFLIGRSPNPHLSFGLGAHACLGTYLARLQVHAVFSRLLSRFPQIDLEPVELEFRPSTAQRGLRELPVRVSTA
jgi:cytochrome P450